jgi:hypothetical protein
MTIPPYRRPSTDPRRQVPCWPNQPRIVVFLTRDLDRFTGRYLLSRLPFVFLALFAFDQAIGDVFRFVGYDSLGLLKQQYAYASKRLADLRFVDFQILEVIVWFSIVTSVARLAFGLMFLKQYDRRFIMISEMPSIILYLALALFAGGLYCLIRIETNFNVPIVYLLMRELPRAYFVLISMMWVVSLFVISSTTSFIVWQLFRQNWPGAVLWSEGLKEKGEGP